MAIHKDIKGVPLKVLILEDSFPDYELISEQLIGAGYVLDAAHAQNEREFTSYLSENTFDVILSDFSLPAFDAFAALRISSKLCPDVPFICISGSIGEETAIDLLKQGAVDYVLKDRPDRLPFSVKRALDEAAERSSRKRAQEALKESEEKFRNMFQHHSAVKLIIDPEDGTIIEANDAASRFYGYAPDELVGMNMSQINTLSVKAIKMEMERARKRKKIHFHFRHRRADGTIVDVEVFSSLITIGGKGYLHSVIHDVTEKIRTERQLRKLSRAVEQSPASVVITDRNGRIEYVNPKFLEVTGYRLDEVLGMNPNILKSGEHSKSFYQELWDTITRGDVWRGELKNKKKDGTMFWESASISPIKDEKGNVTHYLAVKEDVTEQIITREIIQKNLEEKNVLLSEIHHRVKNNMAVISSLLELQSVSSETDNTDPDKMFSDLQRRIMSMSLVHELVYETKNFSEIDAGKLINRLVGYLHDTCRPEEKDISIDAQCDRIMLNMNISVPLTLFISEVITNAYKHAFIKRSSGSIRVILKGEEEGFRIVVQDDGAGVPDTAALTGSNSFSYTIIQGLVRQLRGDLEFESAPGKGLRVEARFPGNL
ncbi:PAS domain S-box protein [Balneolales bacterium ANBcel1]|nr:PAS domain S-box protein [Balneolales bacterium ANBcel1]